MAVKAALFNSASPLLVHLLAKTLKVCLRQFGEALSLQSGPECCINTPRLSRLCPPRSGLLPLFLPHTSHSSPPRARVYYSSKTWRRGLRRCTFNKHIWKALLFMNLKDNRPKDEDGFLRTWLRWPAPLCLCAVGVVER